MKKNVFFLLFVFPFLCFAHTFEEYLAFLKLINKENGSYQKEEIEIVTSPSEIQKIEAIQRNRLLKKGYSEIDAMHFSKVGIVSEDQYIIWIRDAVYFPKGIPGTYDRILWKNSSFAFASAGAAVLPILPDGSIVLNLNYRHATRSWELELPRGGSKGDESAEQTAIRELKEETGLDAESTAYLGMMAPDSGILGSTIPIYLVHFLKQGTCSREDSEAISDVLSFTKGEIERGLVDGFLEVRGKGRVPLRDPFLAFALLQASIRKLL